MKKPVDDLIRLLGLEVPPAPLLSLLSLSPESVAICWKPPEQKGAVDKYTIRVNGTIGMLDTKVSSELDLTACESVGEIPAPESAITIKGLTPASFCSVRVIANNSANFQATSGAINIRTPEAPSAGSDGHNGTPGKSDIIQQHQTSAKPFVVPYKGVREGAPLTSASPQTPRDHGPGQLLQQRRDSARRISPAPRVDQEERRLSDHNPPVQESVATVQELTDKLGVLRKEIDEIDQQDRVEDDQYQNDRDGMTSRRDQLRNQLREKDEESKELNKNVTILQRQSTAAQTQKKNQERLLQTRRNERQKLQDDSEKWLQESAEMQQEIYELNEQKSKTEQEMSEKAQENSSARLDDQQAVKQLEEQIRDVGKHVKELEEGQKAMSGETEVDVPTEWDRKASDEDYEWTAKINELREAQQTAFVKCFQAQSNLQNLQSRFQELSNQRHAAQTPYYSSAFPGENVSLGPDPLHESPKIGSRFQGGFSSGAFPTLSNAETRGYRAPSLLNRNSRSLNPTDLDTAALFRSANAQPASQLQDPMSHADVDRLTGGAMTSPSAGGLLPSGLLGDEMDDTNQRRPVSTSILTDPDSGMRSALDEPIKPLPGLGTVSAANSTQAVNQFGPISPSVHDSRSPSLTSSPHESVSGLQHQHKLSEGTADSDRRSLASTGSRSQAPKRSRMFGEIFGNRQRGKTDEGPALGSLKTSQSQSMPRHYDTAGSESDVSTAEPRRGASGGFLGSMSNAMLGSKMGSSGVFGSRVNPWARTPMDPAPPSRPSSMYSAENMLPRPLTDSQPFGWNDGLGRSNTTRTGRQMTSAWSGIPSRRHSIKTDPPVLPLEDISQLDEDSSLLPAPSPSTPQPPIGTKSKTKKATPATQLNPNARDFRSMFNLQKRIEKEKDKEKEKERPESTKSSKKKDNNKISSGEDQYQQPTTPTIVAPASDSSPPSSQSRQLQDRDKEREDTPSFSTAGDSSAEDFERRSIRTSSSAGPTTPQDGGTPTPNSANRESFMKKITRKGSSSKFSLPGLKARSATKEKASSVTNIAGTGDETDEELATPSGRGISTGSISGSPLIGGLSNDSQTDKEKERDSTSKDGSNTSSGGKRSSGFSLSSFKRRAKKGREKDPPSISETSASMTSDAAGDGTGDEGGGLGIDRSSEKASLEE